MYMAEVKTRRAIWYRACVIEHEDTLVLGWNCVKQGKTISKQESVRKSDIISIKKLRS